MNVHSIQTPLPCFKFAPWIAVIVLAFWLPSQESSGQERFLIRVSVDQSTLVGHPLAWDSSSFVLLKRDGSISSHAMKKVNDYAKVNAQFAALSATKMQEQLRAEFGDKYKVTRTESFLVVHPRDGDHRWATTFENMFRQFKHYSRMRGCNITSPEFPLVAIVFKTRGEFTRYAIKTRTRISSLVVGYYSLESNRIVTFDQGKGNSDAEIIENPTVLHEAAHQSAFNTGVHNRFSPPPKWATEGLAVMFEAPGVHYSSRYSDQKDRINQARLAELRYHIANDRHKGKLADLVESDKLFSSEPSLAYSLSWGLTFYFAETQPRSFFSYLNDTSKRKAFSKYSPLERKQDFSRRFGGNYEMLESRLERFIEQLKTQ